MIVLSMRNKHIVIYDGDCGFCQKTVQVIRTFDWLNKLSFIPFQQENILNNYKDLSIERCKKEIILVIENEREKFYFGGYDAFKKMTLYLPLTFLISWFFFLPPVAWLGRIVYKKIALNRHKILTGNTKCKI